MPKPSKTRPVVVHRYNGVKLTSIRYDNFKQAAQFTAMSLADNGVCTKREAQEWQATVKTFGMQKPVNPWMFDFVPADDIEDASTLPYIVSQVELSKSHTTGEAGFVCTRNDMEGYV